MCSSFVELRRTQHWSCELQVLLQGFLSVSVVLVLGWELPAPHGRAPQGSCFTLPVAPRGPWDRWGLFLLGFGTGALGLSAGILLNLGDLE